MHTGLHYSLEILLILLKNIIAKVTFNSISAKNALSFTGCMFEERYPTVIV